MDGLAKSGKLIEAKIVFDEMRRKEVKNGKHGHGRNFMSGIRKQIIFVTPTNLTAWNQISIENFVE